MTYTYTWKLVPRIGPYPTTDQIIIFIELWLLGFCIRFVMIPNDLELFVIVFSTIINNDSHSYSRLVRHMSYNPIVIQPPFSMRCCRDRKSKYERYNTSRKGKSWIKPRDMSNLQYFRLVLRHFWLLFYFLHDGGPMWGTNVVSDPV